VNAVSYSYADGNGINFFTATFEMCGNSSFRSAKKLIRGMFVYVYLKFVYVEVSTLSRCTKYGGAVFSLVVC
jgi:hypothetical protein